MCGRPHPASALQPERGIPSAHDQTSALEGCFGGAAVLFKGSTELENWPPKSENVACQWLLVSCGFSAHQEEDLGLAYGFQ